MTDPAVGIRDVSPDLAFDAKTGLLAVPYFRTDLAVTETDIRLVVVDSRTLRPLRDVLIAAADELGGAASGGVGVLAEDGSALVYWESAAPKNQNISIVDLATGQVRRPYTSNEVDGIDGLTAEDRDLELVRLQDGPAVLFLHRSARPEGTGGTASATHRFVLQPIDENGPAGEPIVLDGGQPILADVTFDLALLRANPKKAVCGSPCLLSGTVVNRGSRDARNVTVEVYVDGVLLGTLEHSKIGLGDSVTFAKVWDVPSDLAAEQVQVEFRLTTAEAQYTLDNDTATTTVQVRQKGLVQGRVTNASGVVPPDWWTGGLPGVAVSYGGRSVLTDTAGMFAIEDLEFGRGTLTATKEGFNPVSLEVETRRTAPIVIGGSSVQETAARVDGIDVVDKESGQVFFSDRTTWYSYDGIEGDGSAFKSFEMPQTGIDVGDVRILVWVTVQKYWQGVPRGTCFDQREKQVVIFDPYTGGMKAIIAPGDLYKAPERWTTADIERLIGG